MPATSEQAAHSNGAHDCVGFGYGFRCLETDNDPADVTPCSGRRRILLLEWIAKANLPCSQHVPASSKKTADFAKQWKELQKEHQNPYMASGPNQMTAPLGLAADVRFWLVSLAPGHRFAGSELWSLDRRALPPSQQPSKLAGRCYQSRRTAAHTVRMERFWFKAGRKRGLHLQTPLPPLAVGGSRAAAPQKGAGPFVWQGAGKLAYGL